MSERDEQELARFVERFALDLADAGFPRMPARVLAVLLASESGSATATELATSLQISAAAVSGAVRYLSQLELVTKEREPGARHDTYRVRSDLWYEAVSRKDRIYARWSVTLREGVRAAGPGSRAAERLEDTRRFFEFVVAETPAMMRRWREIREDAGSQPATVEPEVR